MCVGGHVPGLPPKSTPMPPYNKCPGRNDFVMFPGQRCFFEGAHGARVFLRDLISGGRKFGKTRRASLKAQQQESSEIIICIAVYLRCRLSNTSKQPPARTTSSFRYPLEENDRKQTPELSQHKAFN